MNPAQIFASVRQENRPISPEERSYLLEYWDEVYGTNGMYESIINIQELKGGKS